MKVNRDPRVDVIERRVHELSTGHMLVWARHMAARYNGRVYLTGSVLRNPAPRDVDVRIVVQDTEFAARYGNTLRQETLGEHHPYRKRHEAIVAMACVPWSEEGPTQRWIDDVAKFTSHLSTRYGENFDVQVVPDSWWRDVYPDPILLAAPSPGWWIYNAYHPDPSAPQSAVAPDPASPPDLKLVA